MLEDEVYAACKMWYQTNARIQQNSGAAAAVLLKLMADSTTRLVPFDSRKEAIINLKVDVKKEVSDPRRDWRCPRGNQRQR